MLLVTGAADLLQVTTSAAGQIEVHASWVDNNAGVITPGRTNTADITTATTTTVVGSPGASIQRNVKKLSIHNHSATVTNVVEALHTDGTVSQTLIMATLLPHETLVLDAGGVWTHYSSDGVPKLATALIEYNNSTAAQGPGFATDTYLAGSYIKFPKAPKIGTKYYLKFDVAKTAAGTATPIIIVRVGTAGTTGDTARNTFTFLAGTAAVDVGFFEIECTFRAVGASAVLQARANVKKSAAATAGLINLGSQVLQSTSGSFDSTVASLGIGVSVNGGTSAAWTVQLVEAELLNAA